MAQMNTAHQYKSSRWGERIGFAIIVMIVAIVAIPPIVFPSSIWDVAFGIAVLLGAGAGISEGLS